jgi:sugar lactone lactonase YvrE
MHFTVPGSVVASRLNDDLTELLICDNTRNCVTRHQFDSKGTLRSSDVLVQKYLDVPDGVAASRDRRWLAVSNHEAHNVLVYEQVPSLGADARPDGVLRRVEYPHGMCFTADGKFFFVADAGGPWVQIYGQDAGEWRGVRPPLATVRVMDEAVYLKGRENPQEGGPKGLDIDGKDQVLVVTSEFLPLGFFSVPALVQFAKAEQLTPASRARDVGHELGLMEVTQRNAAAVANEAWATARLKYMENSLSWRITAPLRRLMLAVRGRR